MGKLSNQRADHGLDTFMAELIVEMDFTDNKHLLLKAQSRDLMREVHEVLARYVDLEGISIHLVWQTNNTPFVMADLEAS